MGHRRPSLHAGKSGVGKDHDFEASRLTNDRVKKAIGDNLCAGGL
jgi:hypothetical protein